MSSLTSTVPGNPPHRSVCVISGGTASNDILDAFVILFDRCSFVLPVSDNGGSSSEVIRVLGGPSLGDIRSRLVRLIPEAENNAGIKALFAYRLPSSADVDNVAIKSEWLEIVEGSHALWRDIPPDRREAIRAFLVHFEHAILRRAQRRFNFRSGSVGNFWLAGVQLFVRSLQSAIFLFSSVCGISSNYSVIPAINTNSLVTIAAELEDGSRIVGQSEISHPSNDYSVQGGPVYGSYTPAIATTPLATTPMASLSGHSTRSGYFGTGHGQTSIGQDLDEDDYDDSGVLARTEHDLSLETDVDVDHRDTSRREDTLSVPGSNIRTPGNIVFSKAEEGYPSLPSKISRIVYLNTYGQETFPAPSASYLQSLAESEYLVYSCGSLFTSLIPPLALTGVGKAIAMSKVKAKILLLNGIFDRETDGLTAVDFVESITNHLNNTIRSAGVSAGRYLQPGTVFDTTTRFAPGEYVTHLVYLRQGSIPVDVTRLQGMSIQCVAIDAARFTGSNLIEALRSVL